MHTRARADAMLAINADSANQEGAWEFLSFLLSEEVQSSFAVDDLAQGLLEMANGYFIRGIRAMLGGRG